MSILKLVGVGLIGAGCVVSAMMYRDASTSPCCSMGKASVGCEASVGCAASVIEGGSCCESSGAGCSSCPASEAGCGEICPSSSGVACPSVGGDCPASRNEAPAGDVVDASTETAPAELAIAEVTEAAPESK